jgi:hypothetical protein
MSKLGQSFLGFLRAAAKVLPILLGLVGLALVIASISGVFVKKIPPGEVVPITQQLDGRPTDVVHEIKKE